MFLRRNGLFREGVVMKFRSMLALAPVVVTAGTIFLGCGAKQSNEGSSPAAPAPYADTQSKSEASDAMAKLSPEDRAKAEAQKICPVSKEPLGSMGEPIKVTVDGRSLFVCCEGCVEELK